MLALGRTMSGSCKPVSGRPSSGRPVSVNPAPGTPLAAPMPRKVVHMDIDHSLLLKVLLAKINESRQAPITYLKPKQIQCIIAAADGSDVLAILPTGYGKSLIFQAIPIYQELAKQTPSRTIVISPLNVIIEQQLNSLGSKALKVHSESDILLDGDDNDLDVMDNVCGTSLHQQALRQGEFEYLLGHPEDLLSNDTMYIMRTAKWANNVKTIVIDEAHCVVQWSSDFRPKYRDIEQLRAIFPLAKYVALTATASIHMRKDILRLLNMDQAEVISAQIDRTNTKYSVVQRPSNSSGVETSYTTVFVPVMKELKSLGNDFPKTVLYSTLKWCGFANEIGVKILSSGALTIDGVPEVAQFHAPLSAEVKRQVAEELSQRGSELRLLLATEAYGMGVDTPDIRRIMHAGPPCTLETYMQTTGRGGRDGDNCQAILHYNNEDLGKASMTPEMKDYCKLSSCRRAYLCKYFDTSPAFTGSPHDCCDNCSSQCKCEQCMARHQLSNMNDGNTLDVSPHEKTTEVLTKQALLQVFSAINSSMQCLIDPQLYTGLTDSLAVDIAANYEFFSTTESLQLNYFHLKPEHVKVIMQVLESCKSL